MVWKDFLFFIKIGIVNFNFIMIFIGMWFVLYIFGLSFLGNINIVFFILIGFFLIIVGLCVINNWYDWDIDYVMECMKVRLMVMGKIQLNQVLWFGILLVVLGLIMLLMIIVMVVVIGFIGVFMYVVLYIMWMKCCYMINIVVGSVFGVVLLFIGWMVVEGNIGVVVWVLFMILFIWQIFYFLVLVIKKMEDYRVVNILMFFVVYGFEVIKR